MEHEITAAIPLLDGRGELTEPGWARGPLPVYDRAAVGSGLVKLREWELWRIAGQELALTVKVADRPALGLDEIVLWDRRRGCPAAFRCRRPFPRGCVGLGAPSRQGVTAAVGHGYGILLEEQGIRRVLTAHVDRFLDGRDLDVRVVFTEEAPESLVTCVPLRAAGSFRHVRRLGCLRAEGAVTLGGETLPLCPQRDLGALEIGQGVWKGALCRSWGTASGLVEGEPLWFYLSCGEGNTPAAGECALLWRGRLQKWEDVRIVPEAEGALWHLTDGPGQLALDFRAGPWKDTEGERCGTFTGRITLQDGTALRVEGLPGFAGSMGENA